MQYKLGTSSVQVEGLKEGLEGTSQNTFQRMNHYFTILLLIYQVKMVCSLWQAAKLN